MEKTIKTDHLELELFFNRNEDPENKLVFNDELNKITLFVGKNGTGKSLLLKIHWLLTLVRSIRSHNIPFPEGLADILFQNTFPGNVFDMSAKIIYGNGDTVSLASETGKIIKVESTNLTKEHFPPANFMSAEMRLFSNISHYLKDRKRLGASKDILNFEKISELSKEYKFYDIYRIEGLIAKCPIIFDSSQKEILEKNFEIKRVESIDVDIENCDFFTVLEDRSRKYMKEYSNGEQSILNIMMSV